VEYAAAHIQHMQKALMEMNLHDEIPLHRISGRQGLRTQDKPFERRGRGSPSMGASPDPPLGGQESRPHGRKRSAVVELILGNMGSMQRETRPSIQREDQLTMETQSE
jgi:hypothetical protein